MYEEMQVFVRETLEQTNLYASELEKPFAFRNRFTHSMRVLEWASRIQAVEKGDGEVISIAAIFHDVGKGLESERKHAEISAEICEDYLKRIGFDPGKSAHIVRAVRRHSSKLIPETELSLEERILMDADQLDELGALCVLWDSLDAGKEIHPSYEAVFWRIFRQYQRRINDAPKMKTPEGKRLYQERVDFLRVFLNNLQWELGIKDEDIQRGLFV